MSPYQACQRFQAHGLWIMDSDNDFRTYKRQTWTSCNKMDNIWRSNLPNNPLGVSSNMSYSTDSTPGHSTHALSTTRWMQANLLRIIQNLPWRCVQLFVDPSCVWAPGSPNAELSALATASVQKTCRYPTLPYGNHQRVGTSHSMTSLKLN